MMSRHFDLSSEITGAIAKRLHIYIYIRVLQEIPKFESYNAHPSNGLPSSPSIHHKIFIQFGDGLVVAQGIAYYI